MVSPIYDYPNASQPPWLADCIDPEIASAVFETEMNPRDGLVHPLKVVHAEILRLKPTKRCLISYFCQGADESPFRLIGKVRFKGLDRKVRSLTEYLLNHRLGQTDSSHDRTAVIPRVYGELACWNMVVFEYLRGTALDPGVNVCGTPHAFVADALCDLHGVPLDSLAGKNLSRMTHHTVADELAILRRYYFQFSGAYPHWSEQAWRIWDQLQAKAEFVQRDRHAIIHRDFYFDQALLLPGRRVAILDLDLACLGPPELDAGNYIAHLRERAIRTPQCVGACRESEQAFTSQFLRRTDGCERNLSFWILVALARLAALSARFPERVHTTSQLLRIVETELQSLELR